MGIPLLACVVILVFCVLQLVPGDPVQALVGPVPVTPEFRAAIEAQYGLNDPFLIRLWSYISNVFSGDLGISIAKQQPVLDLLLVRGPRTFILAGTGYVFGIAVGLLIGVLAATSRPRTRSTLMAVSLAGYALPSFWLGQLLVILFAIKLGWFPVQGMAPLGSRASGLDFILERAHYIALPAATYAIYEASRVARYMDASLDEVLRRDYITTAEQKGLSRKGIIWRHALRNSVLPMITALGYSFGIAMGGTVLIEIVFSWPGIGTLLVDAVRSRDNQVIVGVVIFVALAVIFMNIVVDVLYRLIDPRIGFGRT
jgi:peptide/nickel transport system permease protein